MMAEITVLFFGEVSIVAPASVKVQEPGPKAVLWNNIS